MSKKISSPVNSPLVDKVNSFSLSSLENLSTIKIDDERENQQKKLSSSNKLEIDQVQIQSTSQSGKKINNDSYENLLNRDKAYDDLKKIADFLKKIEPHSPTPYLLYKLAKWKNLTLEELVNDTGHEELLSGIMGIINSKKSKN